MKTRSTITSNPSGVNRDDYQHFEFRLEYLEDGEWKHGLHRNYASVIGEALWAFHRYVQHELDLKPGEYRITQVYRLLRAKDSEGMTVIKGMVPVTGYPTGNPPVSKQARLEDHTEAMPFLAECQKTRAQGEQTVEQRMAWLT